MGQSPEQPLGSAKRERFCQEYLVDANATQAAIRAGYSAKTAHVQGPRLLGNVSVSTRLDYLAAVKAEQTELSARWVLARLHEVADRCMEAVPVRDRRGNIVEGQWTFDAAGANRSLELIGKHFRMWVDRHEHTGADGQPLIPPGRLTQDETRDRLVAILGARN